MSFAPRWGGVSHLLDYAGRTGPARGKIAKARRFAVRKRPRRLSSETSSREAFILRE